jgi:hypothetical protein
MPWVAKGAVKNVAIVISDQEGTPLEKFYFELELRMGLGSSSGGGGAEANSAVEDSRRHALRALMLKLNISDSYGAKFIRHARVQKSFDAPSEHAPFFLGERNQSHPPQCRLLLLLLLLLFAMQRATRLGTLATICANAAAATSAGSTFRTFSGSSHLNVLLEY